MCPPTTTTEPTIERTLVVIGASGCVSSCALPLICREFQFARITLLDLKKPTYSLPPRADFHVEHLTQENYEQILTKYAKEGDICLNLSVIQSTDVFIWCLKNDVMYLDTSGEFWYEDDTGKPTLNNRTDIRNASLSLLHHKRDKDLSDLFNSKPEKKDWATCVGYHGMNPGLVNQFMKQALQDIANELIHREEGCKNRDSIKKYLLERNWAKLSQSLGVKAIHISERDTQCTTLPRKPGEFQSTWSVDGFLEELKMYSEIGLGTHEKRIPREATVFTDKGDVSAVLGSKATNMRIMSWVPSGPLQGFPCPHDESITMAKFLEVRDEKGALEYRPTIMFAYLPCDASVSSIHDFAMNGYEDPKPILLNDDTIVSGMDEVGVLLMGHELGAWWTGTRLDIKRSTSILEGHNATTMQVAAGVIGALSWMIKNPKEGFNLPEDIPHEEVLEVAMPYIEPYESIRSDWSPIKNRSPLSLYDYIDRFGPLSDGEDAPCIPKKEDEWQLATMMIQPSGNEWVRSPVFRAEK